MLAPNIPYTKNVLAASFNEILSLNGYAMTASSIRIARLTIDPAWLPDLRTHISLLAAAGAAWIRDVPAVWAPALVQFVDYASNVAGVTMAMQRGDLKTRAEWMEMLRALLLDQAGQCAEKTDGCAAALQKHIDAFQTVQPLLEQDITRGWAALAAEEQVLEAIYSALGSLEQQVAGASEDVTATVVDQGRDVFETTVETVFEVVTEEGASFSFLSFATSVYTVGQTYYDIITSTDDAVEALRRIARLQDEASEDAQAAAATKAALQLVYNLLLSFERISDLLPQIAALWRDEQARVAIVIDALDAGADPTLFLDLRTLPAADATWQDISQFAATLSTFPFMDGQTVQLNPQNPIL